MRGTVKRIVADKGFGFIKAEDGYEYFFHKSALQDTQLERLAPGMNVEFTPSSKSEKGPRAEDVYLG